MIPSQVANGAALLPSESVKLEFNGVNYYIPKRLENRFTIGKGIDRGSFGAVFDCQDTL